jgi:hypothetical protein
MTKRSFEVIMGAAGAAAAKVKREHLPAPPVGTSLVISLGAIEMGALDLWIADQPDPKPTPSRSRAEADQRGAGEEVRNRGR